MLITVVHNCKFCTQEMETIRWSRSAPVRREFEASLGYMKIKYWLEKWNSQKYGLCLNYRRKEIDLQMMLKKKKKKPITTITTKMAVTWQNPYHTYVRLPWLTGLRWKSHVKAGIHCRRADVPAGHTEIDLGWDNRKDTSTGKLTQNSPLLYRNCSEWTLSIELWLLGVCIWIARSAGLDSVLLHYLLWLTGQIIQYFGARFKYWSFKWLGYKRVT